MRQACGSKGLPRRALAGVALVALLAWAPLGVAIHAPAYADEAAQATASEGITFDAVSPEDGSLDAGENESALADEGAGAADEDSPLDAANNASAAAEEGALIAGESDASLADEAALTAAEDDALLPDAISLSDLDAALPSGDPVAQVQALGIATEPSQVEGYDPAADEEPAQDADEPRGYDESVSAPDEGVSEQSDSSVRVGDWSYHETEDSSGQTACVLDGYYGSATSVTLPATLGGKQMYGVRFGNSGLPKTVTSVAIPASIKEIGASAFYASKVTSVTFAANSQLTSIGEQAFAFSSLTEFTLPAHVKTLGHNAFSNSRITKLTLNTELEPMVYTGTVWSGNDTFEVTEHYNPCGGCGNVTFVVPSGCKNYRLVNGALLSKDGTILYAQLSDLGGGTYTVPSGVQYIGSYAMCKNATFSQIVLPQGLTTMEQYCLYDTAITSLDMPDSVTHVQGYICEYCTSLTSVRISNNLEELGESAGWQCFYGCSNLTSLTLGSKLRVVGNACFADSNLTSVDLPASLEQLNFGAFGDTPTLKSVTGGSGLRYIYKYAFRNAGITSFPFGKNLKFVSSAAFYNCKFTPSYPSYMDKQSDGYYVYDGALAVRGDKSYSLAWQVLDLVNQERAKQGLSALTMDADLLSAAMQRAAETSIYFDHTRPTGQECFTACSKMSMENIASGSSTAQAAMDSWMDSSGHRANILSADAKSIGIGCVKVTGRYFWVQCFGTDEASAVSKPADVSNTIMQVNYTTDGLNSLGSRFEVYPVSDDGRVVATSGALEQGASQRYALFTYPWGANYGALTRIDDSCITWSLTGTGAKLNASTATVTGTGAGSFTLTASVGGGTVQRSVSRETKAVTYTVSFNSNGGSAVASQTVAWGAKASKPSNPARSGYTFTGWYSDSALTKAYDFGTAVKGNVTLYAGWEQDVPARFKDVDYGAWYGDWVTYASQNGLMTGLKDAAGSYTGYFEPGSTVTRGQVATVLWRAAGSPAAPGAGFPDVEAGAYYAAAVDWCAEAGIVTGYTGGADAGRFCPKRAVSREELATMVWRFAKHQGVDVSGPGTSRYYATTDWRSVRAFAEEPLKWASAAGVMSGVDYRDGTYGLEPQGTASRAMAAKVFSVLHRDVLTGKVSAHGLDGGAAEAAPDAQAAPDEATFDDVPDGAADADDEAFDAVEAGETEEASEADQANETDNGAEATGDAEYPGDDEPVATVEPDASAAPADSADLTEPDTAADTLAEPAESDEAPAANATVAFGSEISAGPSEPISFNALAA